MNLNVSGSLCIDVETLTDNAGNRRAWTYQERLLSRRAIFFSANEAFFVCSCAIWSESTIAEPEHHALKGWFVPKPLKPVHEPPQRQYTLSSSSYGQSMDDRGKPTNSFEGYQRVITEFSSRQLSWPSDGVNAVLGVLKLLGRADKTRMEMMYHGLPATFFDLALLWHPRCISARPVDWKGQPQLPSWSWAGWDSQVGQGVFWDHGVLDESGHSNTLPVFQWHALYGKGAWFTIPTLIAKDPVDREIQGQGPPGFTWQERQYTKPPALPDGLESPRPHYYLYCRTTTAHFHLGPKLSWATLALHKSNITSPYALLDYKDVFAGTIILSPTQAEDVQDRKTMKFIFLSYACTFDPRISLDGTNDTKNNTKSRSYAGMLKKNKWWLVNCMWIRKAGKAVERKQIARITVDAWLSAQPKVEWIILG